MNGPGTGPTAHIRRFEIIVRVAASRSISAVSTTSSSATRCNCR